MVGKNTLIYDNPFLTVRRLNAKNPKRIILNKNLDLPKNLNVFNGESENIIISHLKNKKLIINILFLISMTINFYLIL